ncbi:sodium:solute symporter [Lysinibacter cavernae]|uniref:SSS family solute:Na+ symporter n=1 Tax=Lysinibacter cavernae TaxID=1640652 RepID=A0A7X5TUC8_9MICO|nr:sodium:solute symporter [Lysinibacter cavernae]NIH55150.1 SSS family solute:Na+ symporter [Lysinibacter cavernae]
MAVYIIGILGVGYWGMRRSKSKSDYLVAGRRLGTFMYSGALSAIVLGGASTVGGIGLGYTHGLSGAWLVVAIGLGILVLSAFFAKRIVKLKVYTVTEMLDLRYGGSSGLISGLVMFLYTLMLTVTSTLAYATIFHVLFGIDNFWGIAIGGVIVVTYSVMGGMWSITLTDVVQFVIKTIGILFLLLPISMAHAGGWSGMRDRLADSFFSPWSIGGATIITYIIVYTLGLLIGQDIWQRVFTAKTPRISTVGGIASGIYCLIYGVAGALIGMSVRVLYPNLASPDEAFATIVQDALPPGIRGLVLAAALAAMMSTASGALIASSTVLTTDIIPRLKDLFIPGHKASQTSKAAASPTGHPEGSGVASYRAATLILGVVVIIIASLVTSVVAALTIAYNILVGGLFVAILGGLVWKRGTRSGALASILVGTVAVIVTMFATDILANEPIYYGLGLSLVTFVVVSLLTKPTDDVIMSEWSRRLRVSDRTEVNDIVNASNN